MRIAILPPLRPALVFAAVSVAAAVAPRPCARAVPIAHARPLVYGGRLVRADRVPVANVKVWLDWIQDDGFGEVGEVATDPSGAFTIALAAPLTERGRGAAPRWLGMLVLDTPVEPREGVPRSFDATDRAGDLASDQGFLAVTVDARAWPDRDAYADPVYPTFRLLR